MMPLRKIVLRKFYNESLIRTRNTIERVFGIWKRKFPILALGSRFAKVERILPVIVATAILHNIVRRAGDPLPDDLALQLSWEEILNQGNISLMNDASGNNHVQNILTTIISIGENKNLKLFMYILFLQVVIFKYGIIFQLVVD